MSEDPQYGKRCAGFEFDDWFVELAADYGIELESEDNNYVFANKPYFSLPIIWSMGEEPSDGAGGKPVDDPLTIHTVTNFFGEAAWWNFSFGELVLSELSPPTIGNDSEEKALRTTVAQALRDLADKVEAINLEP